ncbi:MAG: hypothetical protein IPP46_18740 [Bacteroidetes bacterium]|nr:hypothetical protein [Bacteroidota bacterium]
MDCYPLMLLYIFLNNPTFLIEHLLLLTNRTYGLLKYGMINLIAYISAVAFLFIWAMDWNTAFISLYYWLPSKILFTSITF